MQVNDAQREMRAVYMGGFQGQLVSGILWLVSAGLSAWVSPRAGIIFLCAGGVLIFPLTQLLLRLMGRPASVRAENPLRFLAMQVAFTLPLNLPLVAGAALYRLDWFYPAFMIALGTHYLPFVFLYGMRSFYALSALLVGAGVMIALYLPAAPFSLGGWLTAAALLIFALIGLQVARREARFAA